MTHKLRIAPAVFSALALAACQARPAESPAAAPEAAEAPQLSTAVAGSGDAPSTSRFTPPPDGRLTTDQVRGYLGVRRRALELARPEGAAIPLPQLLATIPQAEARAASELDRDLQEYRWVQARVAEATGPAGPADEVLRAIDQAVGKSGAQIQQIARSDGQRATRPESPDSVLAHNRVVVEPFVEELLTLEQHHLRAEHQ